tara:strand:+ start:6207 stop:6635 length:429 start_codon:yes stop_codon:yes gene_type:complete
MSFLPATEITADALNVERTRMDLIAQNIANAHTTKGPDGLPYQRRMAVFESYLNEEVAKENGGGSIGQSVRLAGITKDTTPGPRVYNPTHPHADEQGMVTLPNVKMAQEMVDLIAASRSYEANLSVIQTSRQMAQKALIIGQ